MRASEADWAHNEYFRGSAKGVFGSRWAAEGKNAPESNLWTGAPICAPCHATLYAADPGSGIWQPANAMLRKPHSGCPPLAQRCCGCRGKRKSLISKTADFALIMIGNLIVRSQSHRTMYTGQILGGMHSDDQSVFLTRKQIFRVNQYRKRPVPQLGNRKPLG